MKKQILTAAMALIGIATMAQEKVRVHNGDETYVTTIEQITFDVTDADSAISVGDIQNDKARLETENSTLKGDKATLQNSNAALATENTALNAQVNSQKADTASLYGYLRSKNLYADYQASQVAASDHAYVDLGLSVMWATCNVGASVPEEFGDYFAWGETKPKEYYDWSTYKHMQSGQSVWQYINKYQADDHQFDGAWYKNVKYSNVNGKTTLEANDDAATANWGGNWAMPTAEDWAELYYNTTQVWTNDYNGTGASGYVLTSTKEGYGGASMFLPAAGYRSRGDVDNEGSNGYYWSSSLDESSSGYGRSLHFGSGNFNPWYDDGRYYGQSVRPVCPSAGNTNGHVYVDLGLPSGKLWAACNVGASAPQESGDYFAWGETKTKSIYSWDTYSDGEFTGDSILTLEAIDDAARANWGGKWRMPTVAEWEELYNNTTQVWTDDYNGTGVKGYVLTSTKKGYEGASLFLPAAGNRDYGNIYYEGSDGYYWSSSLYKYDSYSGRSLSFYSGDFDPWYYSRRCSGQSVRPVCPSAE